MERRTQIRNSTAEFLIFTDRAGESSIEARYEDESVWLSQKLMAELFAVDVRTINEHLKNIFATQELEPERTIRKFRIVQQEGTREVTRSVDYYHLDAIISVGYRVNSIRATSEFERYRIVQDRLFESDFDKELKRVESGDVKRAKQPK